MSIRDDFTIKQGVTYVDTLQCQDGEGQPVPLTGCTAVMHVRAVPDALAPILALSTSAGGLEVDGPAGVVRRTVSAAVAAGLPAGTWPYDLLINWPDSTTTCLAEGEVTVQPVYTRLA